MPRALESSDQLLQSADELCRVLKWRRFLREPVRTICRRLGLQTADTDWHSRLRRTSGWPAEVSRCITELPAGFVTGWSLGPETARWVYKSVASGDYRTVVECGSGLSTVLIAMAVRYCREQGVPVQFYSLEHDLQWLRKSQCVLRQLGLSNFVCSIHSPLEAHASTLGQPYSYRTADVPNGIDLLLIDGPPAKLGRYAVVPTLLSKLSAHALVVLDDAARLAEQQCVRDWTRRGWLRLLGFIPLDHGLAVLRRNTNADDSLATTENVELTQSESNVPNSRVIELAENFVSRGS